MKNKKQRFAVLTLLLLGFFNFPIYAYAADSDIVISEIGAYETSDNEWVEIYNKGAEPVDLTNWKFYEDQTNHRLSAFQNDLIIDPGEYAIIANKADLFKQKYSDFTGTIIDSSWSSLREDGEEIGLKNSAGETIEIFTYLPCPDTSLQRVDLNLNDYTTANWQVHAAANSAGKANEFPNQPPIDPPPADDPPPDDDPPADEPPTDDPPPDQPPADDPQPEDNPLASTSSNRKIVSSGTLVINEFVSDPADGEVEWLELYNKNIFDIDLAGYTITDGSGAQTNLTGTIGSNFDNKFLVIENPKGKLNNSGDAIILKDDKNNIIDAVFYGNWDNGFPENNAPVAKDPDSTARIFDGAETFNNKNDFAVTQTPTKGEANIISLTEEEKSKTATETTDKESKQKIKDKIVINELFPNPPGSDLEFEFIELKNTGDQEADLKGWQIQDASKKKYRISINDFTTTILKPNEFLAIERKISGLALNNDKETLKLISPDDKTIQTVKYSEDENVPENTSYIQDENGYWFWTITPTPGKENVLTKLNHAPEINLDCPKTANINEIITCDASDSFDLEDDELNFTWQIEDQSYASVIAQHQFKQKGTYSITLIVSDGQLETKEAQKIKITATTESSGSEVSAQTAKSTAVKSTAKKSSAKKVVSVDLKDIKNLAVGTLVKTQGVVSVLPNIFGKTMMYVAGSGIQVYMSKANWPDLKIGDLVDLNGTLSEALGEKRIKLASAQDIKVISNQDPPQPKIITSQEINNDLVGYLVQITGLLLDKNGSKFMIKDESGEAEIYFKTNTKINKANFAEGDNLKITGILSKNNEEYRILPRSEADIEKQIIPAPEASTQIPPNKLGNSVLKYLIASAVFLALSLAAVIYKFRKPKT
ncbi:MAG: lamin tail domain-containing protein [Patescibacteria group bacterium]